jgi:hypothetical protein
MMTMLLVEREAELRIAIIATLRCHLVTLWIAVRLRSGAAIAVELRDHKLLGPVAS